MKAILDRKKSSASIVAASRRWASATAEGLEELLRPELADGETLPDLELLQQLLGRALARRWRRLEAADQARQRAAARRRRHAAELAAARAALYARVVDLRRLMRGVFGGGACRRLLGIAGATSRDDVVLLRQASHLAASLSGAQNLPPASFEPTAADLARWRSPVETAVATLRTASDLAAGSTRELEAAGVELGQAITDFDRVLLRVGSTLDGAYTGAGREERRAAVRPSRRRLGRLLEDDDRSPKALAVKGRAAKGRAVKTHPLHPALVQEPEIRRRRPGAGLGPPADAGGAWTRDPPRHRATG